MLIEAASLPQDGVVDHVCIVGAGVAGITLALELEQRGISTLLLEAGGRHYSAQSQSFYDGSTEGLSYDLGASRTRQFGGSSNCWWGWCAPFSEVDFRQRSWVPNSGWPIGTAELAPYYGRAADLLQIEAFGATRMVDRPRPLNSENLTTRISHLSPPARLGDIHFGHLSKSRVIKLMLNTPVLEIETSNPPSRATGVRIRTGTGERVLSPPMVILATGGIENARLMLLSNAVEKSGLGNRHDNVGRYFMDHPRLRAANLHLKNPASLRRLYDVRYYYKNRRLDGRYCGAMGLTERQQEREGLLQCFSGLIASYVGEDAPGIDIAKQAYKAMMHANSRGMPRNVWRSIWRALPAAGIAYAAGLTRSTSLVSHFQVQSILEPTPDPANRVTLGADVDDLGRRRPRLIWRSGELEHHTHLAMIDAIRREFEGGGLGRVEIGEHTPADWQAMILPTQHHMGTTRMSADPRTGVVDTDCRVHGYANLFVAGSSVFPTGGGQPPTFTIVALALRLAETIARMAR